MAQHRETTVTVFGTAHTVRTEQTGTVRQLETAHTKAVKATLEAAYAAGKPAALIAAKAAVTEAAARCVDHHSGPLFDLANDARDTVTRIEKRKFGTPTHRKVTDMARPFPPVKFDADPTDPKFADYYEHIDPNAAARATARYGNGGHVKILPDRDGYNTQSRAGKNHRVETDRTEAITPTGPKGRRHHAKARALTQNADEFLAWILAPYAVTA